MHVSDVDAAGRCIAGCGFAFWPDAFAAADVDALHEHYGRWFVENRSDVRHYLSYNSYHARGGLSGRREQSVFPSGVFPPALEDAALHNRAVVASYLASLRALGITGRPMLNWITIIQSSSLTATQDWHTDAPLADGLKVQVPLVDVTADLGPLEIKVRPANKAKGCPIVRGTVRRGTALMYRHSQPHRGTAAAAVAAASTGAAGTPEAADGAPSHRVVLDISYMLPSSVARDDYLARHRYTAHAAEATRAHRVRSAALCAADLLACAAATDAGGVRGGAPYAGPVPAATNDGEADDGWVGEYRGVGNGSGTWVDANGSVYTGAFVDGLCHGRGRYTFANGDVYEGDFAHDLRHGRGRFAFGDRDEVYEGEFVRQQRHGRATVTMAGFTFEGLYHDGHPAEGRRAFADGRVHAGTFRKGALEGPCSLSWPDGSSYEGTCARGLPHGRGRSETAGGDVYDGEWERGKQLHAAAAVAGRAEAKAEL